MIEQGNEGLRVFNRSVAGRLSDPAALSQYVTVVDMLVSHASAHCCAARHYFFAAAVAQ